MPQNPNLPATFPARVDGQLAVVAVTPPLVKWNPTPAEFSSARLDGRWFDITEIEAMSVIEVGVDQTLKISLPGLDVRIFARAELIERLVLFLESARTDKP